MLLGSLQLQVRANRHVFGASEGSPEQVLENLPAYELNDVRIESKALLPAYIQNLWGEMKASFDDMRDLPDDDRTQEALSTFLKAMQEAVGDTSENFPDTLPPVKNSIEANEAVEIIFSAIKRLFDSLRDAPVPIAPITPVLPKPGEEKNLLGRMRIAVRNFVESFEMTSSILFTDDNVDVLDKLKERALTGVGMRARVENGQMRYAFIKDNEVLKEEVKTTGPVEKRIAEVLQVKFAPSDPQPPQLQIRMRDKRVTVESTPTVSAKKNDETPAAFAERVVKTLIGVWEQQHLRDVKQTVQLLNDLPGFIQYEQLLEERERTLARAKSAKKQSQATAGPTSRTGETPKTSETSETETELSV
jgi:hypothetical protein